MYDKRCRENKEEQEKVNQTTKRTEMEPKNKTKQNKKKYHLEQIDLDLKAKMEYEQKITLGISRSVGTNIVHSFL